MARQRLTRIASLLGKNPGDMHVLDIGCSRGQFVAAAIAAGYDAEGVEPARLSGRGHDMLAYLRKPSAG